MNWLVAALVLIGVVLIWRGRTLRRATGVPWRRIVYQDTQRQSLSRPLFAPRFGLTGQPDYVLAQGNALIPVEVKPTRRDQAPRHADMMQVAAYCLLLEETTGIGPPYGLLRYAEASFEIRWDDQLYEELVRTLELMRADLADDDVPRSHEDVRRCRACGFADRCEDSLWQS